MMWIRRSKFEALLQAEREKWHATGKDAGERKGRHDMRLRQADLLRDQSILHYNTGHSDGHAAGYQDGWLNGMADALEHVAKAADALRASVSAGDTRWEKRRILGGAVALEEVADLIYKRLTLEPGLEPAEAEASAA